MMNMRALHTTVTAGCMTTCLFATACHTLLAHFQSSDALVKDAALVTFVPNQHATVRKTAFVPSRISRLTAATHSPPPLRCLACISPLFLWHDHPQVKVQLIRVLWRALALQAVEMKFNCFFLMPLVDTFPTKLREELEGAFERNLEEVFDVSAVRLLGSLSLLRLINMSEHS